MKVKALKEKATFSNFPDGATWEVVLGGLMGHAPLLSLLHPQLLPYLH